MTFPKIKCMKKQAYMRNSDKKIRKYAFNYLKSKIKSKGNEIEYGEDLKCQAYLLPNNILTLEEQRIIFSYRSRMNQLKYNFQGTNYPEQCKCGTLITNEHLYYCKLLNNNKIVDLKYENICNGILQDQQTIIHILNQNMMKHEEFTLAQDCPLSRQ